MTVALVRSIVARLREPPGIPVRGRLLAHCRGRSTI
jgi:hypothetical protein